MRKIEYENDTDALRERLQAIEKDILRIAKPFDGLLDDASIKVVHDHLENRAWILNRMFGLHVTEAEVRRFEEVNERLTQLTQDFNHRHQELQQQISSLHMYDGEPFELYTTLDYHHDPDNPCLHPMEDDDFYGSHWNEMLWALSETRPFEAQWCGGDHICDLDDGKTWAEGLLFIPDFDHICICNLVHSLCLHQDYSIPDLLRMTTYGFDYQLNCAIDIVPTKI